MSTTERTAELPLGNRLVHSPGWWGMVWIIATEAALFAFMLFSYFYLASESRNPWPPEGPVALNLAIPNTVILVASSFVMWWAWSGAVRGSQMQLRFGLLAVFVLGLAFLSLETIELNTKSFAPSSSPFAAVYYAISCVDLAHVVVALIMLLFLQIWAWMGTFTPERHLAVSNVTMFWHFVVVAWLFVFVTLYLTPRM